MNERKEKKIRGASFGGAGGAGDGREELRGTQPVGRILTRTGRRGLGLTKTIQQKRRDKREGAGDPLIGVGADMGVYGSKDTAGHVDRDFDTSARVLGPHFDR